MRSSRTILIVVSALALVALTAGCSRGNVSSGSGLSAADKAAYAAGGSSATASDAAAVKNQTGTDASATDKGSGAAAGTGSAASGTGSSASGTGSKSTKGAVSTTTASGMKIRLIFWNDTSSKPLKGTEIVAGSSSFKPRTTSKNVRGATAALPYGKVVQLMVYPDGRTGKKITVPVMVFKDMLPNSEQDAIHIAISDGSVRILGNPVNSVDQTVPRF